MNNYRYQLDKSSKKYPCPDCGKKRMVKYIDIETKQYLPDQYGKCDRLVNCGYDCNPYKQGYHKTQMANFGEFWQTIKRSKNEINDYKTAKKPQYPLPENVLLHTLKNYEKNNFIQFLLTKYDADTVTQQIENYFVGTVNNYTSFAYIDSKGTCLAIALIQYDTNGKRIKNEIQARNIHTYLKNEYKHRKQVPPDWLTNYLTNENTFNCLYGEHLINLPSNQYKPIAVVEAPKTAFIASMCYSQYVWLAVGALSYLTVDRLKAIIKRQVYLFPDTSTDSKAFNLWNDKAKQYGFTCIDLLEQLATDTEKKEGYDLADYILSQPNEFLQSVPKSKINENKNTSIDIRQIGQIQNEPLRTNNNQNSIAYVDSNSILYIPTPLQQGTYTRYANGIQAYNTRSQKPDFTTILPTIKYEVLINLKTLKINN
jgi:ssDNA-binding Zn-finger/Zn-ribbon topoisomerase 1